MTRIIAAVVPGKQKTQAYRQHPLTYDKNEFVFIISCFCCYGLVVATQQEMAHIVPHNAFVSFAVKQLYTVLRLQCGGVRLKHKF